MGRCSYVVHDEEVHPVAFRFTFDDYDILKDDNKFKQFVEYK